MSAMSRHRVGLQPGRSLLQKLRAQARPGLARRQPNSAAGRNCSTRSTNHNSTTRWSDPADEPAGL